MIKFFRQIRKTLLSQNKTGTYIKYAIGEIILVVIGILIALSINNWNQQRLLNIEEQVALKNLKQDFEFNRETLKKNIAETEGTITANFQVLNYTGSKPKPKSEDEFNVLLNQTSMTSEFFAKNSFLDNLSNSGKLGIIRNVELRDKLSSWKPAYDDIKDNENQTLNFSRAFVNFVVKNGSWLNADQVSTSEKIKKYSFPKSGFVVDNRDILMSLEFENMVENLVVFHDVVHISQKSGLELIEEILQLIDSEIQHK
jgi:hypothetical protein